jgi:hypothetical protein
VELKQKRKEVQDGECVQKETANPAVFTSPQQLSGNQSKPLTFSAFFFLFTILYPIPYLFPHRHVPSPILSLVAVVD